MNNSGNGKHNAFLFVCFSFSIQFALILTGLVHDRLTYQMRHSIGENKKIMKILNGYRIRKIRIREGTEQVMIPHKNKLITWNKNK